MLDKMKQLMEVKRQADQLKKELDAAQIEVNEVQGIRIAINGSQTFLSLDIDSQFLNADNKQRIEKDLLRSLNSAVRKSQMLAAQKMKTLTGLDIPGL